MRVEICGVLGLRSRNLTETSLGAVSHKMARKEAVNTEAL